MLFKHDFSLEDISKPFILERVIMKKILHATFLLASLLFAGCGSSTEEQEKQTSTKTTGPAGYVQNLANAKNKAQATAITTSLTKAIQQFESLEGAFPKSLNDLVSQEYLSVIPEAPLNMKIEYDSKTGTVTLVPR